MAASAKRAKTAAGSKSSLPPRPCAAAGTFLRIITVNDVYKLDNYARVASAIKEARAEASDIGCTVISTLNGDFLSPSVFTILDGGITMSDALNGVGFDYICLGNHEFDLRLDELRTVLARLKAVVINSNVEEHELTDLPTYASMKIGEKVAVLVGAVTDDKTVYPPHRRIQAKSVNDGCIAAWEAAKLALGSVPDLLVPLTHQLVKDDIATAAAFAKHADLKTRVPCILGGHEHEVFVREEGRSTIVKTGCDCQRIGVVDLFWTEGGSAPQCSVALLPAEVFLEDPGMAAWARCRQEELDKSMKQPLATLESPMSSKGVRFGEASAATFLCTLLKKALVKVKVELVMLNGGVFRATRDYEAGEFTMGHLFAEFATKNLQRVVPMPGKVIADAILFTRSRAKPTPGFLHADDGIVVNSEHAVVSINGQPFDATATYTVCMNVNLLTGLDNIEPLVKYHDEYLEKVDPESCQMARDIILKHLTRKKN